MNFPRFKNYLVILFILRWKNILVSSLVIYLIASLLSFMMEYYNIQFDDIYLYDLLVMNFFLLLNLAVQFSKSFEAVHHRNRLIGELTLPVSSLERFLGHTFFNLGSAIVLLVATNLLLSLQLVHINDISSAIIEAFFLNKLYYGVSYYLLLIFFFFLAGSIFFKNSFFITILFMVLLSIFLALNDDSNWIDIQSFNFSFNSPSESFNYNQSTDELINDADKMQDQQSNKDDRDDTSFLRSINQDLLEDLEFLLIAVVFYLASYLKLKKIQLK